MRAVLMIKLNSQKVEKLLLETLFTEMVCIEVFESLAKSKALSKARMGLVRGAVVKSITPNKRRPTWLRCAL